MDHILAAKLSPIACAVRVNKQPNRQWIFMVFMAQPNRLEVALPNTLGKPDSELTEDDMEQLTEEFDPRIAAKFKDWFALYDENELM